MWIYFWLAVDSRLEPYARKVCYVLRDGAYGLCHARRPESAQRGAPGRLVCFGGVPGGKSDRHLCKSHIFDLVSTNTV